MRTIEIEGKKIRTNLGGNYHILGGECQEKANYIDVKNNIHETDEEQLKRLSYSWNKITFYKATTNVKGIYNVFAVCNNVKKVK